MSKFYYSKSSLKNLKSVDIRLQNLFNEVIKYYNCSIISGLRTVEEQQKVFKKGTSECDGIKIISKHQLGLAVDVVPCPLDWNDYESFAELAGCIKTIASQMGLKLKWGKYFKKIKDYPHWEIAE